MPVGDLVQVLADGFGVCRVGDRQDVLEQGGGQAEGDQRGPAALQIQQLRRGVFGEQLGQRAEGLAVRRLAATAVEAWAGEGDIAEHGAKDDRVLSFAAQLTAAGRTAAVPADEGGSLGGDDMLLQALLQGFALADRQANGFQLMVALLETQDLAVGEHGAIVADDPKLKVNVHGRRHAGVFRKLQGIRPPNYPPSPAQATNHRGRECHCWHPPAQIRACPIRALGSYLGCLTAKRWFGQG